MQQTIDNDIVFLGLFCSFMFLVSVGEDFFQVEKEVSLSRDEYRKTVTVPLVNNDVQDLRRWFLAQLDLPVEQVGVVLDTPAMANITIVDDDREYKLHGLPVSMSS